jgi:Mg-chelatase subunit ChlD
MGPLGSRTGERYCAKKVISPDPNQDLDLGGAASAIKFQSIFKSEKKPPPPAQFLPPESMSFGLTPDEDTEAELSSARAWDIATRYHEFKARPSMAKALAKKLRKLSAEAILQRAQEVLGSVVHPVEQRSLPWSELPSFADQPDIDLEETLENSPLAIAGGLATAQDIWMEYNVHRKQPVILSVDTSLSMTGEKLALTAVALAVVLLQFPEDPVGIVAFENEAKVLKRPDERLTIPELLERFLDVPAQGYTHLEDGMKAALALSRAAIAGGQSKAPSTVLLTDGKYTAGRDPAYLACRFNHLVVLKMGKERASLELCRELARKGKGVLREVGELEALPSVMYGVVKDLLRGRSLA